MRSPARSPAAGARSRPFDRHSATGMRGLPKKGGAGGKGVWGAAADQEGVVFLDKNDPNYDSDAEPDNQRPLPAINLREPAAPVRPVAVPGAAGSAAAQPKSGEESAATSPAVNESTPTA